MRYEVKSQYSTHTCNADLLHNLSAPPLLVMPTVFTVGLRGIGVDGGIYMVMTLVSHAVRSARTCLLRRSLFGDPWECLPA